MILKTINLHCTENGSDKVYNITLEDEASGSWRVRFEYGRRGGTLVGGTKGNGASLAVAEKAYTKLINDKLAKGYREISTSGPTTPSVTVSSIGADSGFRPQLLNEISQKDVKKYIEDPMWCMMEKYDGVRRIIQRRGKETVFINKKGFEISMYKPDYLDSILPDGNYFLDGEQVGATFIAFDHPLLGKGFKERFERMQQKFVFDGTHVQYGIAAFSKEAKETLFAKLRGANAEGVVFKKIDSLYTPGRPNSGGDQLKFKFTATASCIVKETNTGKRSIALQCIDIKGKKVDIGSVTIYPNQDIPKKGEVVEVKYLYYFPGGSLFQPVLLATREDVYPEECLISKLKVKRTVMMVEEEEDA